MANSAPYEVNVTGTDDETFAFSIPWESADGTPFPFDDYEIEYAVGTRWHTHLRLSSASGITVVGSEATFKAPRGSLCKGEYEHGCRIRHRATGDEFQVFDGIVTIREGNF